MTTNHKEKLDPALLRPGRCDFTVKLNNASQIQLEKLFMKFNPNHEEEAIEFAKNLPEHKISMAKLQGHFLKYRDQPLKALANSSELMNENVD